MDTIVKSKKKEIKLTKVFEEEVSKPNLVQMVVFKLKDLHLEKSKVYITNKDRYILKWKPRNSNPRFVGNVVISQGITDIIDVCVNDKTRIRNLLNTLDCTQDEMIKNLVKELKDFERHIENVKNGNPVTIKVIFDDGKKAYLCGSSKKDILINIKNVPTITRYKVIGDASKGTVLLQDEDY